MENTKLLKAEIRKKLRKKMQSLNIHERKNIDMMICRRTLDLQQYKQANTVFLFLGVDWEINTAPLISDALKTGKTVLLPRCGKNRDMQAVQIYSLEDLSPGSYGIPEPKTNCNIFDPSSIDFAVLPCIACDISCMRLGQGGGYYDSFLENTSFYTAAICRDSAILPEIPCESWDKAVDCVITESRILYRNS